MRGRRLLAPLLAAASLITLACSSPEERFAEHVERAQGYIAENRGDDALIELQSALKIDPDDPDVNQQIAGLLKERGSIQAAAFHYGETYRLDPDRVEAAVEQAVLLWQTAPRRAQQILRQVQQRFPDDARVYRGLATLASSRKDSDAAVEAAKRAVELAPEDPDSWATLGAVYLQRTRDMRDAGERAPDEDFLAGIEAFEKMDELTDGHVGAQVERARLLANLGGRDDEAVAGFRSAVELARSRDNPATVVFAARRFAGHARRHRDAALHVEALRAIVEAAPEQVRNWEELADASRAAEGPEAAEAVYAELLEKQGDLPASHIAYSRFLVRTRRPLDAIAHLDQAITEGHDAPALWEQLVRLELSQRRNADARATIEDMRSRVGDHDATRRSEARLALREKRPEEALEILSTFAGSKESAETEMMRAEAEMMRGDLPAAASAAQRAVTLAPRGDTTALRLLAEIHDEAGDWQAVLATLSQIEARGGRLAARERVSRIRATYETGETADADAQLEALLAEPRPPADAAVEFARRHPDRSAEARAHLQKALRRSPGYHPALEAITRLDLKAGQPQVALARLDRLVERQLAGPRVLLLRSQILLQMGQLDRAEADALRAFEAIPELVDAVDTLFVIYQAQDRLDEARRSFEEAESVGVLHKGARVLLGRLYAVSDETEKARAMYEKVLEEDPDMTSAKLDLARLLADDDSQLDRALQLAEEAQRDMPDDPAVADTVGYLYYRKGRHVIALQQYRYALDLAEARELSPPALHYHMGLSLAAIGRTEEARAAYGRALEIDPRFQDAQAARDALDQTSAADDASGSS
ncbi:MAG: tetratricopeptide repeat protein [Myxococcota bacterium]